MGTNLDRGLSSPCFPHPLSPLRVGAGKIGGLEQGLVDWCREEVGTRWEQLQIGGASPPLALLSRAPWTLRPFLSVAGCGEKEEPQVAPSASCHHHCCSHRSLDLTGPLLLGGVPDLPESFPVQTRHFVGCIRNLQVDSRHVDMADFIANNGTVPGMGAWGGARPGAPCTEEWLYLVWRHLNVGSQNPSSHCHRTPT